MAANALFDPPSDIAVTIPGEAELIKELTKLLIIHKVKKPKAKQERKIGTLLIPEARIKSNKGKVTF
jgi:hypothetical protein